MRLSYFLLFSHVAVSIQYLQLHLRSLGYSAANVGLLVGLVPVSGVIGALLMGLMADRRPITKPLLMFAISGAGILFLLLGSADRLIIAIPLVVAMGMLFRSEIPLLDTHVSLLLTGRDQEYGRIRVWGTIGFVAASLVFQFAGYPRPEIEGSIVFTFLVVTGAFLLAAAFLPGTSAEGTRRVSEGQGELPSIFWALIGIAFLSNTGFQAHAAFFSLYVQDMLPGFLVSGAWGIGAIAEIPVVLMGGLAVRRFGIKALLISSGVAMSVRLLIYALAPDIIPVLLAQLLHAFTFGALHIAAMSFISRAIPPGARGRAVSLYNALGYGLPGLVGGVVGGQILERGGFFVLFLVFAIPPALSALLGLISGNSLERAALARDSSQLRMPS